MMLKKVEKLSFQILILNLNLKKEWLFYLKIQWEIIFIHAVYMKEHDILFL